MEQMTLFPIRYKYIMDASSFNSQKSTESHTRRVNKTLWTNIERLIRDKIIITCSEIKDELTDPEIATWCASAGCTVIDIDDEIQNNVIAVVTRNPKLVDFKATKQSINSAGSSGDVFLIATAMKYHIAVITEENKNSPKKIPAVCRNMGVDCINISELCEREGWEF